LLHTDLSNEVPTGSSRTNEKKFSYTSMGAWSKQAVLRPLLQSFKLNFLPCTELMPDVVSVIVEAGFHFN
jgi:hypothetical protein